MLSFGLLIGIWGLGAITSLWLNRRLRQTFPLWQEAVGTQLLMCFATLWLWQGLAWAYPTFLGLIYRYVIVGMGLAFTLLVLQISTELVKRILPQRLPRIFFDLTKVFLTTAVGLTLISALFGVDLAQFFNWLFTISTIGAVVIGFALQETLGNLFAGIGLQIDAPFKLGDWVKIEDFQGEVLSLSWRATVLRTVDREIIAIPNSVVGRAKLKNLSQENAYASQVSFGLGYEVPPGRVIPLLRRAAQSVEGVLQQPAVTVFVQNYGDYSIEYGVMYWSRLPGEQRRIRSQIRQRVWYALQRAKISVPFPVQDLYLHRPLPPQSIATPLTLQRLRQVDFMRECPDSRLTHFLEAGTIWPYTAGETICRMGEPGEHFFIILSGQVQIVLEFPQRVLGELQAGNYFGEISLLTGQSRTATVLALEDTQLLVFDRLAFQELLDGYPVMAERIARVIAERQQAQATRHAEELATPTLADVDTTSGLFDLVRSGIVKIFGR